MDRVQRKRTKGSRLPPNTLVVTRGALFGNPFYINNKFGFEIWKDKKIFELTAWNDDQAAIERCVELFSKWWSHPMQAQLRQTFIWTCDNKNIEHLACWCELEGTCHADLLIDFWNEYQAAPAPFELIGWDGKALDKTESTGI